MTTDEAEERWGELWDALGHVGREEGARRGEGGVPVPVIQDGHKDLICTPAPIPGDIRPDLVVRINKNTWLTKEEADTLKALLLGD